MFPGDAVTDNADSGAVNAKGCRHLGVRKISTPKPSHVFFGQLGVPHLITSRLPVTPLPVGHIVGIGSNAKMPGLHADSPIARMKHMQSIGNRADVNTVRRNMSGNMDTVQSESTVPVWIGVTSPVPTTFNRRLSRHVSGERFSLSDSTPTHNRPSGRVTVTPQPGVVRTAQPLGYSRICAINYRTLHLSKFTQSGS